MTKQAGEESLKAIRDWVNAKGEGVKTLTTADYNYPETGTKTEIAPWLLDDGYYKVDNAKIRPDINNGPLVARTTYLIKQGNQVLIGGDSSTPTILSRYGAGVLYGTYVSGAYSGQVITCDSVVNNLTSATFTDRYRPLSAAMGRELNNRIGDLSTLTTTNKSSAVAAINELAGSAGGEIIDLAMTDTLYASALNAGIYRVKNTGNANLNFYISQSFFITIGTGCEAYFQVLNSGPETVTRTAVITFSNQVNEPKTLWVTFSKTTFSQVAQSKPIDVLTSTASNASLSAAQGKVLKDLIDSLVIKNAGAPTTSTVGTVGKLLEDTTNGKLYQCTAVNGSTYTWTEITKTSIKSKVAQNTDEDLSSLYLAGKPENNLPYALMTDKSGGTNTWSYIRGVQNSSGGISQAYVGSYVYDAQEDWWSGKRESRLALYSDIDTVYDSTVSLTNNGSALDSFTVNASANKTIALDYPVITMTDTDPGEGVALAANHFIAVYDAS